MIDIYLDKNRWEFHGRCIISSEYCSSGMVGTLPILRYLVGRLARCTICYDL